MRYFDAVCLSACLLMTAPLCGCAESTAAVEEESIDGTQFLLAEEPGDVMCVCAVRDILPNEQPVAILGRIGGIENPWTEGEASFVMSDPSLELISDGDHQCGDNCPYCAKKQSDRLNSMAFVQIVDDQGHVIRTDARRLLGVAEDQMVVILGRVSLNRTGHMVVAANGLYVRE